MMGSPSMNFIRKIYNIIAHKQEKLDQIAAIESLLAQKYGGDLRLAEEQVANGNWTMITQDQITLLKQKEVLQTSINEYQTIFNIYQGFHKKSSPKVDKVDLSDAQLDDISQLIAVSQNNT